MTLPNPNFVTMNIVHRYQCGWLSVCYPGSRSKSAGIGFSVLATLVRISASDNGWMQFYVKSKLCSDGVNYWMMLSRWQQLVAFAACECRHFWACGDVFNPPQWSSINHNHNLLVFCWRIAECTVDVYCIILHLKVIRSNVLWVRSKHTSGMWVFLIQK